MSKVYKSARGKLIDIDKVKLANENVAAIGNMRVNARGDILGANGKVSMSRNEVMDRVYAVESAPYSPNDPTEFSKTQQIVENNRAKQLHDLANNLVQSNTMEPVVDSTQPVIPPARGSLAASVAKTQTIKQQPLPNPKKPSGPTRI
jgi:Flp pilus assembly protein TadG